MATVVEAQQTVRTYNTRYNIDLLTWEMPKLREQHAFLTRQLAKAEADVDQATKFRPSYAPAGIETRTEKNMKAVAHSVAFQLHATHMAINLKTAASK